MRRLMLVGSWLALACVALFVAINIHEIGHVVVARVMGDSSATYHLYENSLDQRSIGHTSINDAALTADDLIAVYAAGVATTQILAVIAGALLRRLDGSNSKARPILISLIAACLLDAFFQALQGFRTSIPPSRFPTGVDAVDFAHLIETRIGVDSTLTTWCMLLLSLGWIALYLWVSRSSLHPSWSTDQAPT
ncbi:MAG: hypothetical protein GY926_27325 [bacterium]|nr:hypothetical protein [bacterium]MCP4968927.1 hypothetical protein [bacterium]